MKKLTVVMIVDESHRTEEAMVDELSAAVVNMDMVTIRTDAAEILGTLAEIVRVEDYD